MKYYIILFYVFFYIVNDTIAQKYTLNTKEVSTILNIEPFNDKDSIINATIIIKNLMSDTIWLPEMKAVDNINYFFFLRGKTLYFYAGMTEYCLGINEPGYVEIRNLLPGQEKSFSVSIKVINEWGKIESVDINEIVFRVEYLSNINPNIIKMVNGKTIIKGSIYWEFYQILRGNVPY